MIAHLSHFALIPVKCEKTFWHSRYRNVLIIHAAFMPIVLHGGAHCKSYNRRLARYAIRTILDHRTVQYNRLMFRKESVNWSKGKGKGKGSVLSTKFITSNEGIKDKQPLKPSQIQIGRSFHRLLLSGLRHAALTTFAPAEKLFTLAICSKLK